MKEIILNIFSDIGQKLAVILLVGTTAVTTGTAVARVGLKSGVTEGKVEQKTISNNNEKQESESSNTQNITSENVEMVVAPTKALKNNTQTSVLATPTPTPIPTITTSPKNTAVANGCIVTLFGQQFDVTSLRSSHSGGDIFVCGTDMTSKYQSKHGSSLSRMARYAVSASGSTSGSTSNTSNTSISSSQRKEENERHEDDDSDDDREDGDHEDRYVESDD